MGTGDHTLQGVGAVKPITDHIRASGQTAAYMTAPKRFADSQIPLAPRAVAVDGDYSSPPTVGWIEARIGLLAQYELGPPFVERDVFINVRLL
jgi:hypothetical protein